MIDPYATHLGPTVLAAVRSGVLFPGSLIVELGCGDYSTPVLTAIAAAQDRTYHCFASDAKWLQRYDVPSTLVASWDEQDYPACGMALLDSEELVVNRVRRLEPLAKAAKIVVMHDAREDLDWDWIGDQFRYLAIATAYRPWTLVASREVDVTGWW